MLFADFTCIMIDSFDDIRPYTDAEVDTVLARLLNEPAFNQAIRFVFPNSEPEDLNHLLASIHTIADFQSKIVSAAVKSIADKSTAGLEVRGLNALDPKTPYLFISNHRDIVLDSAFLNYILFTSGFPTTRIAIGNNLLQREWIADLVKLNKNFIVQRNVPPRQAYEYSLRLSTYIKKSIKDDLSSVWIAQREGRTKDGKDQTQAGLLKMLSMAWTDDVVRGFEKMRIVPVSISYGVEPCAGLKTRELFIKQRDGAYEKQPGEDLNSMLEGIRGWKGKVVFTFGSPIARQELEQDFSDVNRNEGIKNLCARIDAQIHTGYELQTFNYIASDELSGDGKFASDYTASDLEKWKEHINQQLQFPDVSQNELLPALLAMYEAPVGLKS
jgi:glycerol-3-phosphate O-acyltransferase